MLQNIRDNSTGWISKTIIGLIVVLLSFTGFEAILSSTSNSNNAAKVNGEEITLGALAEAKSQQHRQLAQQFGADFDSSLIDDSLLTEAALQGLITQKLLLQAADQSGFSFPDAAVDQFILLAPEFQVDGQFNADRFDQVIRQMGYSRLQFRQMIEQELRTAQLRAGIAASAFITEQEARDFARLERQTRDFSMRLIEPEFDQVAVSSDEVEAYYNDNPQRFMTDEQVIAEYIVLEKSAFFDRVEVDESALDELYQAEIANLAEQRQAAHILIEINDEVTDEQALAKAEQLLERLNKGEDFAALAKQASDDIGSAAQGGDLGFAAPGIYEAEFEDALYALDKGQVSAPVRTDYGWHLIKLLDIRTADIPSFASLKDKLMENLKTERVEQRFVEVIRDLEGLAYESADLQQPAHELSLTIQESEPFGRQGAQDLFANRQVIEAAFSVEVLEEGANSAVLELDPETAVVLRVKEHLRPEQIPFAQVSTEIQEQLIAQKAIELARQQGEALLAQLQGAESLTQAELDEHWQVIEAATRDLDGVDPQVLQTLFKMPRPADNSVEFAGIALNSGQYAVVRLTGVNDGATDLTDEELDQYQQVLASRAGQVDFSALMHQLELDAKIERY